MKQGFCALIYILMLAPVASTAQVRAAADKKVLIQPLRLRAMMISESSAGISWTIASEREILQYEIERSEDGKNFRTVGLIFTAEDAKSERDYEFTDELKNSSAKRLMYRVKIVTTRSVRYSETVETARPAYIGKN